MEWLGTMLFLILVMYGGYMFHDMVNWNDRNKKIIRAYNNGYLEGMKDLASVLEELEKKA